MYSIHASSIAEPARPRPEENQDQFDYRQIGEHYALIVCDGVSSSPHAQEAARLACNSFIGYVADSHPANGLPWTELIVSAIRHAHHLLLQRFPGGDGLTTATAALVIPRENQLIVGTVGDSPAYYVREDALTLCTPADVRVFARLQNGSTIIHGGMPILDQAVTASLGARQTLEPHVFTVSYEPGDAIVLCTNGVTMGAVATVVQNRYALNQRDMDDWLRQSSHETDDDAALVIMQLGRSSSMTELDDQLERYVELSTTEKQALLTHLTQSSYRPLPALLRCYELESVETRKISIYHLMGGKIPREKRIALADDAAKCGQPKLLQEIVISLRN